MNEKLTGQHMNCSKCGKDITYAIDNMCPSCYSVETCHLSNDSMNYECPDCHGKFNEPSYGSGYQNNLTPKCPFCGKIMKGLE